MRRLFLIALVLFVIGAITPALLSRQGSTKPAPKQHEPANLVREREAWFYGQRAYPLGHIPAGARLKAFRQLRRMVRSVKVLRSSVAVAGHASPALSAAAANAMTLSQTGWTLIGPKPTQPYSANCSVSDCTGNGFPTDAGRVNALAFDPRDTTDKTIYLGSAEGGLWVTTDGGQTWTPLTDSEPSLAVGSIALDPTTNPTTIYIGTGEENFNFDAYYGAGVLKSTDGGKTWAQDQTFSQTAVKSPSAGGPDVGSLAVDPSNNQVLLAGVGSSAGSSVTGGIWRSTDDGGTWTAVLPEAGGDGTSVVFDPSSPGVAYAALGSYVGDTANGVYKSTDDGATWTQLLANPTGTLNIGRVSLAVGPPSTSGAPGELLAAIADASTCKSTSTGCSNDLLGVWVSTDGGTTWNQLTNTPDFCGNAQNPSAGQCWYDMSVGIDPQNPAVLYAGGNNQDPPYDDALTVSTNSGSTWSPDLYAGNSGSTVDTSGQLHTDTHAIAFAPDGSVLAVGNDGGVWTTTNVGASSNITWNDLNGPLAVTQFYPGISIFPGNAGQGLGGTQDNGTQAYSGGLEWQGLPYCGDGAATALAPSGSAGYMVCAANEGIYENAGSGWAWAGSGIGACTATTISNCYHAYFAPPLAMDPQNPSVLYFGAGQSAPSSTLPYGGAQLVYQTTNGGQSWQAVSPDLAGGQVGPQITAIGVAPTSSDVVFAGTGGMGYGSVWATKNATAGTGATWQQVDAGLPKRTVTDVAVDPSDSSTAYVSYSGFSSCSACDGLGHIFETTNSGTSWASITGDLPDIPVNALVVDPAVTGTIYAATDVGVFATTDGGSTWTPLVTGLPNVAVLGLTLDPSTRTLWAGTHGRSMWALQLPKPPTATPSPGSLSFSNEDVGSTSSAQTITLSNTGGMALAISSIKVGSPFSESNTCGSSLAAGANCTVSVSFDPSTAGSASGTLTVNDDLRSGPQTMAISGTGQDFAVSSSTGSATVSPGSTASYTISVAPKGGVGFTNSVSLACSGLPSEASCSFSPASVTPGSATATSTLTISTTAASSFFPALGPEGPSARLLTFWLGLLLALAVVAVLARRSGKKLVFGFATCALLICLVAPVVSCGGGGSGSSAPKNPGTPAGTYSVTLTGTSNQLQHSTTVSLTVQ